MYKTQRCELVIKEHFIIFCIQEDYCMALQQLVDISVNDQIFHHLTLQSFPHFERKCHTQNKRCQHKQDYWIPLFWLFQIVLSERRILCFWRNYLLANWIEFFNFCLHKLVSYHWDQGTNFSQLILGVDIIIAHKIQVPKKFLVAITRHGICYSWTIKFSASVRFIGW